MRQNQSDSALAAKALGGSQEAYADIVRLNKNRIYSFLLRLCGNARDAEDIAQETFLRAFSKLAVYNPQKPLISWLLAIAHNCAVDFLRRKNRAFFTDIDGEFEIKDESRAANPAENAADAHTAEALLATLPPHYREVLLLLAHEGLSYEEIAAVTGTTEANVKIRVYRARQAALSLLKKYEA